MLTYILHINVLKTAKCCFIENLPFAKSCHVMHMHVHFTLLFQCKQCSLVCHLAEFLAAGDITRVATAQEKQGIWLLTFPDSENTGNLVNLIFYTGKIVATQGKFCY